MASDINMKEGEGKIIKEEAKEYLRRNGKYSNPAADDSSKTDSGKTLASISFYSLLLGISLQALL